MWFSLEDKDIILSVLIPQMDMCINYAVEDHCERPILSTAVQKTFGMGFANSAIVLLSCPLLDAPKSVVSILESLLGNCNAAAVKLTLYSSATLASARNWTRTPSVTGL